MTYKEKKSVTTRKRNATIRRHGRRVCVWFCVRIYGGEYFVMVDDWGGRC